jgi:peptidoglycan/LPS O-acetylase OafA/YrhL
MIFSDYSMFHVSWRTTPSMADALGNILIFPWAFLSDDVVKVNFLNNEYFHSVLPHYRVVPSTWSVGIEIVCYFFLWLFSARKISFALATLCLGGLWHAFVLGQHLDVSLAYFPFVAAMLPFGFGALAYHLFRRLRISLLSESTAPWVTLGVLVLFFSNWSYSTHEKEFIGSYSYYANILLAFASVLIINKTKLKGALGRFDKWAGDLAYPMFLGHYIFAFIAWHLIGIDSPIRGWAIFFLGSTLTIAASIVVILAIDQKLEPSRNRVRTQFSTSARDAIGDDGIP